MNKSFHKKRKYLPAFVFFIFVFIQISIYSITNWSIQLKDEIHIKDNKICFKDIGEVKGNFGDHDDENKWLNQCFDYNHQEKEKISKDDLEIELIRNNLFPVKLMGNEIIKLIRSENETTIRKGSSNRSSYQKNNFAVKAGSNLIIIYSKNNITIELSAVSEKNAHIGEIIEVKPKKGLNKIPVRVIDTGRAVFGN